MFDFGNVIGIFDTPSNFDFIRRHRRNDLDPTESFKGHLREEMNRFDLGEIDELAYFSTLQKAFQLECSMRDFFKMTSDIISIDQEMVELVKDLRNRGLTTVLVTNMNPYHIRFLRENHPDLLDLFDCKMISCEEGVTKPQPEAWLKPLRQIGFKPNEGIFIDDYFKNAAAARRLGIPSWHYYVTDVNFSQNGRLAEERKKLKGYFSFLDSINLLYNKTRN